LMQCGGSRNRSTPRPTTFINFSFHYSTDLPDPDHTPQETSEQGRSYFEDDNVRTKFCFHPLRGTEQNSERFSHLDSTNQSSATRCNALYNVCRDSSNVAAT